MLSGGRGFGRVRVVCVCVCVCVCVYVCVGARTCLASGELGLLGITVPEEYGGSGIDASAAAIVHEELAAHDPAFCLSFLAHSMLFVSNLAGVL